MTTSTVGAGNLGGLAEWYAADPASWPGPPRFNPDDRWYSRLARTEDHEAWLLTWLPGQGTPLHDHGDSAGAFAVAGGALTEVVVSGRRRTPTASQAELDTGRLRFFGPHYVHQVTNRSGEPAVSLHVYAPRLTAMNTYRLEGSRLVRTGTERAGVDW